jgi:hypothetical protein
MPEKSPSPSLFHKLLCLQPQELSPEEFYATLYQFTQLCWVEEYPERPWNGVPIPLEYDPTSPSLHHQVDLYKLYLHVMAIGGSQRTTATDSWRQIGYISGLNVYDNRPEALATVCQAVYFRYLRCYEVYSDIVRTMYWEHLIKPSNYKYSGTRRGFLHNDAQWRNRLNQLPDIGIRSRLLVDLPTHPTRRYANELLELRESIKRDTERESGRLVFRGVDLHLVPDPDPLPVVHLHPLFKNLVRPMDSVSNTDDDDDTLGVNPYSPYDGKIRSYSPPLDPRVEQERQRLMARNRRGLRDERKRTPPPRTVFQVDDLTWDSDNDSDSNAAGKQKEQEEEGYPALASRLEDYVKRAISVDHDELEAKYGITKFEEHPESKGSFLEYDFGDYLYYAGMEGLMPIWREWIKSDPGFHAASREVDTDG